MSTSQLEQTCPMCGERVSPGADVCIACGESVKERRPLSAGERYILRRFRTQMMMLRWTWYLIGGFLMSPLATDWLLPQRVQLYDAYLSLVLKVSGVALLALGWVCRRWPQWGLRGSLVAGYAALGCYLFRLASRPPLTALLLAIPILLLAHIAHWTAHDVKSVGIALDDKR